MILKKETLVFLTSLAIIFIIGYVNLTMGPKDEFNPDEYAQMQEETNSEEASVDIVETSEKATDETQTASESEGVEGISEILGDITDITDVAVTEGTEEPQEENTAESGDKSSTDEPKDTSAVAGNSENLNMSFASFKLSKEKSNMEIVDQLEQNLSSSTISEATKKQFEDLLLNKNNYIKKEQSIELMLQSKGYDESVVVVDEKMIKVITNDTIEQADATKILDVVVSETSYEPSQIKIVKFDNIDL